MCDLLKLKGEGCSATLIGGTFKLYSCLKTVFGSTWEARRAGRYTPRAAMASRASGTGAIRAKSKA
jgi:hypothetical protein